MIKKKLNKRKAYYSKYIEDGIILNANESPYAPPLQLKEHMSNWCLKMSINRYPDTDSTKLINSLSNYYKLPNDYFICGVGSDQLIDCMLSAFVDENELVMIPDPSFSMYAEYSYLNNAETFFTPLNKDFSYNMDILLENVKKAKISFICSPNNPTGSVLTNIQIEKLAKNTKGIIAIDEAYGEFNDESAIDLIKENDNIILFKTFSKAYGLAGARIGYAVSNPKLINGLKVTKPPYNLNSFSIEAADYAINNHLLFADNIKALKKNREYMYQSLKEMNIEVYKSKANFLWCKLSKKVLDALEIQKIFIRTFKSEYVRISIGTDLENKKLLEVIICEMGK